MPRADLRRRRADYYKHVVRSNIRVARFMRFRIIVDYAPINADRPADKLWPPWPHDQATYRLAAPPCHRHPVTGASDSVPSHTWGVPG